jgi:selenocysteine-specific elongation factor
VLDVAPVRKASKAAPDRSVERVVAERGWIDVAELELLTGQAVEPTIGHWVTTTDELAATRQRLQAAVEQAGELGLDLATLTDAERAVLVTLDGVAVAAGRARPAATDDPFADHPLAAAVLAGGFVPELPPGTDRATLRELVRRGVLVERDGVVFHVDTIAAAAQLAAELLAAEPAGFTVAQFRDAVGASRKYVLPLIAELDARAVTRRRDDVRIAGPRLPG